MADLKLDDFGKIADWKLLAGSHEFPGPSGGTCINEAAIVAAGFAYRPVESAASLPQCFSPVLGQFAIHVNDGMPDRERHRLLPLVVRLAGSADAEHVGQMRANHLFNAFYREVLGPINLHARCRTPYLYTNQCFDDGAERLTHRPAEAVKYLGRSVAEVARSLSAYGPLRWIDATEFTQMPDPGEVHQISDLLVRELWDADVWMVAFAALLTAFEIGNQAPDLELGLVKARMDEIRQAERESVG